MVNGVHTELIWRWQYPSQAECECSEQFSWHCKAEIGKLHTTNIN
jgi:hypothetical protein